MCRLRERIEWLKIGKNAPIVEVKKGHATSVKINAGVAQIVITRT